MDGAVVGPDQGNVVLTAGNGVVYGGNRWLVRQLMCRYAVARGHTTTHQRFFAREFGDRVEPEINQLDRTGLKGNGV